jgi:hypothetical protein
VYITPQNHGFAVDVGTLPADWKPYFVNANDGSNEGIMHTTKPIFSVQFHPEARGGPYDTKFLFQKFYNMVTQFKSREKMWENKNFNTKVKPSKVLIIGSGALQIGKSRYSYALPRHCPCRLRFGWFGFWFRQQPY